MGNSGDREREASGPAGGVDAPAVGAGRAGVADVLVRRLAAPIDLEVQHPAFPALDEQTRAQVGFIALDTILGEEEVERWIGSLSWSASAPTATVTPDGLRAEVERLRAAEPTGEWALLRGDEVVAVAARPLRPVDLPYLDLLCELETWATGRGYETRFSLDPAWDAVRRFASQVAH